jgi:hypothetical protein
MARRGPSKGAAAKARKHVRESLIVVEPTTNEPSGSKATGGQDEADQMGLIGTDGYEGDAKAEAQDIIESHRR